MMQLTCEHCKKLLKTLDEDELSKVLYSDHGLHYFCSRRCMEKWANPYTPDGNSRVCRRPRHSSL
ncbi:MAG: hypothetical protein JSU72_12590 [Deltaproteobacteria bacterium]|nr:MAG: hypothetical protein JSU72_12590 [Deltaproteobacteria bacterium]